MATPSAVELFAAVDAGDVDTVGDLLDADPALAGAVDEQSVSSVRHALYRGHRTIAQRIASAATALDVFDLAALGAADQLRDLVRVDPLAAHAFSPDGFTALHFAAFLGGADVARALLDADADVNAVAQNTM